MHIGMMLYSDTGNTLSVATKLQQALVADGHEVTLVHLETVAPLRRSDTTATLTSIPAVDDYEALVFACPVRGGLPIPPMRVYLEQVPSLAGRQVACLVTGFFPAKWGRNQTLAKMQALIEAKGGSVCAVGSVRWSSLNRKGQIVQAVESLRKVFALQQGSR